MGMPKQFEKVWSEQGAKVNPMKRIGRLDDVVNMVMYLSNNKLSSWITGQVITLDGGYTLRSPKVNLFGKASKPQAKL